MFTGEYVCRLGRKGRLTIPGRLRGELLDDGDGGKARGVVFAVADTLRIYPEKNLPAYIDEMKQLPGGVRQALPAAVNKACRRVQCSLFGRVGIPGAFLRHYGLAPGDELLLRGCDTFIEVAGLQYFPVHSPGLKDALELKGERISELEAQEVWDIRIEDEVDFPVEELRPFQRLHALRLVNCGLRDIGFVGAMGGLTHLELRDNRISEIGPVRGLRYLNELHIAENPIASMEGIEELADLEILMAFGCGIADIPALPAESRLRTVHLNDNRLTHLDFIRRAGAVTDLLLDGNKIRDIRALAGKNSLRYLHLADNLVEDVSVLLTLPGLARVRLSGNPIPPAARQRVLLHTVLNEHRVSVLPEPLFSGKRRMLLERYAGEMENDALLGLLLDLIFVQRQEQVLHQDEHRFVAKSSWDAGPLERAAEKVCRMRDGWEKARIQEWIGRQEAVRIPVHQDCEEAMSPGRPGSLRFFFTPGGGIVGPGEPYTIDRSDYEEVDFFERWR